MKYLTLLSLILMSFALVTAQAETKSSPSAKSKNAAETGIRDWLDRFTKVFSEKNLEAMMAFYADDVVAYDFHDHISVPADMESGKAMLDLKP